MTLDVSKEKAEAGQDAEAIVDAGMKLALLAVHRICAEFGASLAEVRMIELSVAKRLIESEYQRSVSDVLQLRLKELR